MQLELEQIEPLDWRQFLIAVRRLADSFNYGTDRSPFLGSGVEYVQSRRYCIRDPVRSIAWRVTARTGRYFVKQFETPKQLPVYLMLDTSGSMLVSSQPRSNLATALQIAGGLAFASPGPGKPRWPAHHGNQLRQYQPSLAKSQVLQWLHELREAPHRSDGELGKRLNDLVTRLAKSLPLLIVLSDLHEPAGLDALKLAAQRHDVVVLQFRDPAERERIGSGLVCAREPETGREIVVHSRSQLVDQSTIEQTLKRAGIDHLLIDIDSQIRTPAEVVFPLPGRLGRKSPMIGIIELPALAAFNPTVANRLVSCLLMTTLLGLILPISTADACAGNSFNGSEAVNKHHNKRRLPSRNQATTFPWKRACR
jgi:uncharacterized protein (DUF58 family)